MGFIMLILIGTVPTAYALNRTPPRGDVPSFVRNSVAAFKVVETQAAGFSIIGDPRPAVESYVTTHRIDEGTYPSLAVLIRDIANQVQSYGAIAQIPAEQVGNTRNDMYLTFGWVKISVALALGLGTMRNGGFDPVRGEELAHFVAGFDARPINGSSMATRNPSHGPPRPNPFSSSPANQSAIGTAQAGC